jgi:hypothetical protein
MSSLRTHDHGSSVDSGSSQLGIVKKIEVDVAYAERPSQSGACEIEQADMHQRQMELYESPRSVVAPW